MRISELKKEMDAGFKEVRARFEQVDARFAQVDAHFDRLEKALAAEHETTRRHMDILIEQCRAENRLALERCDAHDRRFNDLQASNARDHAVFIQWLQDHNVRLSALENPPGAPAGPQPR